MTQFTSISDASAETAYIRTVNPANPGYSFNCDPACFKRYCQMQATAIRDAGGVTHESLARDICRHAQID